MNGADAAKPVRPLDAAERRVLGTLIEKGKTTPDQYPLSLNALVNGCNQKSNRDPVTSLDEEQVTKALAGLRQCGAIAEVYGNGKIARYRHLAYEWLGASKEELAIIGELLLRGAQTEGDLRGRASRMDEIPDLDVLRRHLDRLAERGLVVWLSPPGRGRMLTHGLLPEESLAKVKAGLGPTATGPQPPVSAEPRRQPPARGVGAMPADHATAGHATTDHAGGRAGSFEDRLDALEAEVASLRDAVAALQSRRYDDG